MVHEAEARLEAPHAFARHRRRRLERDVETRRLAFAAQVQEFRRETLTLLAPGDLLPDVGRIVLGHDESASSVAAGGADAVRAPAAAAALASALGKPSAYAATAAWAVTADELATRGISNRPSLVLAELVALMLTPIAIFRDPEQREDE
jgi:hypothetical protein